MRKPHIIILSIILIVTAISSNAMTNISASSDSTGSMHSHLSYSLKYNPALLMALDKYGEKFVKDKQVHALAIEIHYNTSPNDSNLYDRAFNYPSIAAGIRYGMNHGVRMHRDADPAWGAIVPVDYDTPLGNNLTIYGTFERPIMRKAKWTLATYIGTGVGYSHKKYNRTDQIDNELIGSRLNIYFTGGLVATWQLSRYWALRGGIDFSHHSNGALHRPNKGANYLGPFVGIGWTAPSPSLPEERDGKGGIEEVERGAHFLDLTIAIGAKTMEEDWQRTQFGTPPDQPDYRTDHFRMYSAYSMQAAWMYRYSLTRASGVGADLFYGTYSDHIRRIDEAAGNTTSHSPWSVAIAARHNVYYRNLSARFALGYYLYRHMGTRATNVEKPYYERIGLHYSIPQLRNLSIGFCVKAHLLKADLTEVQLSFPVRL